MQKLCFKAFLNGFTGAPPVDPSTLHTSTAVVVVFITDVNDNKPVFEDCASYSPKIEEGAPNGSPVIKVHAVDKDKGVNGQVRYNIVQQPNQKGTKFNVDEETGEVFTNKVFDREGEDGKQVSVTVKAVDSGEPSLEGVCSFTVEIQDTNDNPPLFDRQVLLSCQKNFFVFLISPFFFSDMLKMSNKTQILILIFFEYRPLTRTQTTMELSGTA